MSQAAIDIVDAKLAEKNIKVLTKARVKAIVADGVLLTDGRKIHGNVPIWATGAEPQQVSATSDLELLGGYFRVNDYLQSTSHPNIFAGGDCISMESYHETNFPPKAGVYAVRAGPFIGQNVAAFLEGKPLATYKPQKEFLSLLMTADGNCIGTKFGIAFYGQWVWRLKDFIDQGFMNLFDPKLLFKDFEQRGTEEAVENIELFDTQNEDFLAPLKAKVGEMDP